MDPLTGNERFFDSHELIVTKTDPGGRITYANEVFLRISGLTEKEAMGQPHNIIRHPHMPRGIFRLLWDNVRAGKELFAYVVNRSVTGDHYWVFAHVTPSFDPAEKIVGFHSNRRVPRKDAVEGTIRPLYEAMRRAEAEAASAATGIEASLSILNSALHQRSATYDEFIFSL